MVAWQNSTLVESQLLSVLCLTLRSWTWLDKIHNGVNLSHWKIYDHYLQWAHDILSNSITCLNSIYCPSLQNDYFITQEFLIEISNTLSVFFNSSYPPTSYFTAKEEQSEKNIHIFPPTHVWTFQVALMVKNPPASSGLHCVSTRYFTPLPVAMDVHTPKDSPSPHTG